jgi:membrane protease YdiL (CAAX protease family)
LLALITVALDFALVHQHDGEVRACVALVGFALAIYLSDDDRKSLGLRASPVQGWLPWISTSLKIGCVVVVCIIAGLGTWVATGHSLRLHTTEPSHVWSRLVQMCFVAPVVEESIYRVSACGLIAAIVGHRQTIAINGVLFGILHVCYGNPSPENLVGGFFLAWSFLKSETILIPFILHSGGNMLALAAQVAAWHLLGATG